MTMTQAELLRDAPGGHADDAEVPWPVRRLVLARDNWACLCCARSVLGQPYAIHLRKPWHLGGDTSPENLITVRAECGERMRARCDPVDEARGYQLRPWDNPAVLPVLYATPAGPAKVWLLPDGGRAFEPSVVMNERQTCLSVTIDPGLAAYLEQLVQSGRAPSISAVINDVLAESRTSWRSPASWADPRD
jgi:hypothetical protein